MNENAKQLRARVQHKHKTEAQWILDVYTDATKATLREDPFIPLGGELIIFDKDNTYDYDRIKFGDGINNVIALPFASAGYTLEKDGSSILLKKNGVVISTVIDVDTDTKVTSEANHYTPEKTTSDLSVDASGAENEAAWDETNLVTGINLERDSKGHIVGITVDSIKMPENPNTNDGNDNQTVKADNVTFGANDVVEFVAGSNVSISGDATNKKITINAVDTNDGNDNQKIKTKDASFGINDEIELKEGTDVTITANTSDKTITISSADTKVTAVENHYAPATDNTKTISKDASSTTKATWGTTSLVTGVNIMRDAAGHVTDVSLDSIQMPVNPNVNDGNDNQTISAKDVTFDKNATVKLVEGENVTIETDQTNATITIKAKDTTYSDVEANGDSGLMTGADKAKLDGIENGANKTIVDEILNENSSNPVQNKVIKAALNNKLETSLKGTANGLAELDANGKILSAQLPSYVDDVLEYANKASFPAQGESGKIYTDLDKNLTYRWSGSTYVEISPSLALGEIDSTAYRGDRGKIAYDHSQSPHAPSDAEKNVQSDWSVTDASSDAYIKNKPTIPTKSSWNYDDTYVKYSAAQTLSDTQKSTARANIGAGTSSFSGNYNDLSNKPAIPTVNNATLTIQKNGTTVNTFTANSATNVTANITVPTKTSELQNDSGFKTTDTNTTYDIILGTEGTEAGKLILVGSDGSRDIVELPGKLSQGEVANSIKVFDGNAKGGFSLAMGTADKEALQDIIGFKDGLLYNVNVVEEAPSTLSAGGLATGIMTTAGVKGYYYNNITSNTIKLVTTQNGSTAVTNCTWAAGDVLTIVNDNQYVKCATIKSINKSTGVITIEGTFPFTEKANVTYPKPDDFTVFACYKKDAVQVKSILGGSVLYSESRYYPRDGAVELGWAATTLGALNAATGTGSFVFGYNNWQAGNFGITGGRDNIGGYCGITAGLGNTNSGNHNLVTGRECESKGSFNVIGGHTNKSTGSFNALFGYHVAQNSDDTSAGSLGGGNEITYSGKCNVFGGSHQTITGEYNATFGSTETVEGHYNITSGFNNIVKGNGNAVFGGKVNNLGPNQVTGRGNLVTGENNTVEAGNYSVVGGYGNKAKTQYTYMLGRNLLGSTSDIAYQTILGRSNVVDADAALIIGCGVSDDDSARKNCLTVGKNATYGTRESVDTDAVTVKYLKAKALAKDVNGNINGGSGCTIETGSTNAVFGLKNTISGGNSNCIAAGYLLKSGRNGQALFGQCNAVDTQSYLVIGGGTTDTDRKTVFTVGPNGTRENVLTDGVTVKYFNEHSGGVDEEQVRTIVEDVLLKGKW